jgi:triacylglycerol lipase
MRGDVILLHGLGRSPLSLRYAEYRLRKAGWSAVNIGYPSRGHPIEELASFVASRLPTSGRPMHFLTHSMGGIVLRCLVKANRPPNLGRAVMLGPPNAGSQLASRMGSRRLPRWLMGPALRQIGVEADSVPNRLGPVDFQVGVIAGHRSLDPFRLLLAGESDGRVCLPETRVAGMADWLCVPRGHALLMLDPRVLDQALHFLAHGRFAPVSS